MRESDENWRIVLAQGDVECALRCTRWSSWTVTLLRRHIFYRVESVPQRLDTPLKRHAASCTSNNRLVKVDSFETSFNDSRVRSTSSSRHAAFSRGDLEALACARGLTANWRKSVLLSCCAKCAGRIVGRYYVPEMLVRSGTAASSIAGGRDSDRGNDRGTINDDDVPRRGRGMRSRKKKGRRDADRKRREKAKRGEINEGIRQERSRGK
ncbi:hypothetical protein ALC60_13844 [Trachymyrmex zeteki]|uniref:Uncharacterized protein n=1 Tax=Mycetomoellerius zeteki TaxID=64791 RepID=A0A151WH09_9HYME|nr:hypothetical protein ALC60_13844 [Trachymyrmex zeteki]